MTYGWRVTNNNGTVVDFSNVYASTIFLGEGVPAIPGRGDMGEFWNEYESEVYDFESPVVNPNMVTMEQMVRAVPMVFFSLSCEYVCRIVSVKIQGFKIVFRVSFVTNPARFGTYGRPRFFCFLAVRSLQKSVQSGMGSRIYNAQGGLLFDSGWGYHPLQIKEIGSIPFEVDGEFLVSSGETVYSTLTEYDLVCFTNLAYFHNGDYWDGTSTTDGGIPAVIPYSDMALFLGYHAAFNASNIYDKRIRFFEIPTPVINYQAFIDLEFKESLPTNLGGYDVVVKETGEVSFIVIEKGDLDGELLTGFYDQYFFPGPALIENGDFSLGPGVGWDDAENVSIVAYDPEVIDYSWVDTPPTTHYGEINTSNSGLIEVYLENGKSYQFSICAYDESYVGIEVTLPGVYFNYFTDGSLVTGRFVALSTGLVPVFNFAGEQGVCHIFLMSIVEAKDEPDNLLLGSNLAIISTANSPFGLNIATGLNDTTVYRIDFNVIDPYFETGYVSIYSMPSNTLLGTLDIFDNNQIDCGQIMYDTGLHINKDVMLATGDTYLKATSVIATGNTTNAQFNQISIRTVTLT